MKSKLLILCAYFAIIHLETNEAQRRLINIGCPPVRIKYGRVRVRARMFAQFSCNKGYLLAGDRYSKCTQGSWDSEPPVCVRPNCQKAQQLTNGVIHQSHRGGVLNFYCGANYVLEGPKQAYCVDTKWNTHLPSCLPTNATPSLSCDFETEFICGWTHDLNHNFDWTRLNSRTPSGHLATGPSDDHTKGSGGSGYYMYIEGSSKHINDTARLISPMYKKESNNTCLEFYYHMYGSGIGQLRVYLRKINDPWAFKLEDAIFIRDGNQGNEWWRGFVELGPINDQFQVIFEGIRGFSFVSDIAIDDVKIIEHCIIDNVVTTEQDIGPSTFIYDSCTGKCNTTTNELSCGCDENCSEDNSCCPDYIAVCILDDEADTVDTAYDDSSTEPVDATTISVTIPTTTRQPTLLPTRAVIKTTKTPFLPRIATTTPTRTTRKATLYPTVKLPIFTTKFPFIYTSKIPIDIIPVSGGGIVPIKAITFPTTIKTITTLTTSMDIEKTNKTTISKYFLNDMLTIPDELTTQDEGIMPITNAPEAVTKEYPTDDESNHPILSDKVAPVQEKPLPSNKTTVIAVLTVCFIVVGILLLVFLAKQYSGKRWMRVRRMRSGNGDSQSDVRYLTSDEILDFTIARPARDY